MPTSACPCCSGKSYNRCCGPLLNRSSEAKTAKQLMRSRYSAYALGGHGAYLLETWHPDSTGGLTAEALSAQGVNWQELTILDFSQSGEESRVEFEARFIDAAGNPGLHHETSRFVRRNGKWLYVDRQ